MELIKQPVDTSEFFNKNDLLKTLKKYIDYDMEGAKDILVAGGAARHIYDPKMKFDDIDLYILSFKPDPRRIAELIYGFIRSQLSDRGVRFRLVRNVPTISMDGTDFTIQIINFTKATSIEELFYSYDFTCCQFALYKDILMYTPEAKRDHDAKQLVWTESSINNELGYNIENRFWRIQKYLKKGYTFAPNQADIFFNMPWDRESEAIRDNRVRRQSSGSDRAPSISDDMESVNVTFDTSGTRGQSFWASYNPDDTWGSMLAPSLANDVSNEEIILSCLEQLMGENLTPLDRLRVSNGIGLRYSGESNNQVHIEYETMEGRTYSFEVVVDSDLAENQMIPI